MSHKDGRVVLSAWVEPVLRDYAREAAKVANLEFSRWVERAVRQTMARESAIEQWHLRVNAASAGHAVMRRVCVIKHEFVQSYNEKELCLRQPPNRKPLGKSGAD